MNNGALLDASNYKRLSELAKTMNVSNKTLLRRLRKTVPHALVREGEGKGYIWWVNMPLVAAFNKMNVLQQQLDALEERIERATRLLVDVEDVC